MWLAATKKFGSAIHKLWGDGRPVRQQQQRRVRVCGLECARGKWDNLGSHVLVRWYHDLGVIALHGSNSIVYEDGGGSLFADPKTLFLVLCKLVTIDILFNQSYSYT